MTSLATKYRTAACGAVLVVMVGMAWAADPAASPPGSPPAVAAAATSAPPPDARAQAHAEFKRHLDAGDFGAAADQARKVVELTEHQVPVPVEELQATWMNLALAEHRAGDYVAAEASYQRVIALVESSGRLASPRLARATAGLATTYFAARRYDLAAVAFERAIALNRRAEGLFNEEQLPLLERQSDSLSELGKFEEALLARRYALRVVARKHGERSLRYARELESLGRWYTRARSYEASRATLRHAGGLVESLAGPNAPELVGPLTGLAENARRWLLDPVLRETPPVDPDRSTMFHDPVMPTPPSLSPSTIATEGQKALERAVAIVDAHPDSSPALAAGMHAQLGDWHQARQQPERALPYYRQAWQSAGNAPEGAALRQSLFGTPVQLRYFAPDGWDRHARRPPEEVERRDVAIELTVTAQGGVRDLRAEPGAGEERLVTQALRSAETARYRPRFVDGEPVDTPGVRLIQPFYLLREAAPAPAPPPDTGKPAAPPPPAQGGG